MSLARGKLKRLSFQRIRAALRRRLGVLSPAERARWLGVDNTGQAVAALTEWARQALQDRAAADQAWVLSLGPGDAYHLALNRALQRGGIAHRSAEPGAVAGWDQAHCRGAVQILCAFTGAAQLTAAARMLAGHAWLHATPLEYCAGLEAERRLFERRDEYRDTFFVSPILLDRPGPYAIYEESLQHFEQKCGLRDYLDLYQLLRQVIDNGVPGDIAEFGSYRGHSGYLIARTLQALGAQRRLLMFDTFDSFPAESLGLDHFWNRSHDVRFDEVRAKLAPFDNVTLVRGDFTRTLADSGLRQLALAYIDCDSYRATRFLFDALLKGGSEVTLSTGGVVVCEDYGHPALLGNRAAVHESLEGLRGGFRFFSQFSGLYVFIRMPAEPDLERLLNDTRC